MTEDDDKEVVAQACMSVADIMNDFGYIAVEPCKSWNYFVVCFVKSCACVFSAVKKLIGRFSFSLHSNFRHVSPC